mgnify:CR=1 FL=1
MKSGEMNPTLRDIRQSAQRRAPLFEALERHVAREPLSFHVPGHRGGEQFDATGKRYFGSLLPIDLTELNGLDDLHQPQGAIAEAQQLAAEVFGAEETFFLVGGSTAGNLAMVLAACQPGDKLLVGRDAHRSVFHACMLAGVKVVLLPARVHPEFAIPCGVDPATVRQALSRHPDARAVLLTNPNYYGMGKHLAAIAGEVHAYGIPLLVDEAHGAHFAFHPSLPPTALSAGADGVVQSAHKTLPALTMGAFLHLQGSRLSRWKVRQALAMLQSSSPSYPVLASLDLARRWMFCEGRGRLERLFHAAGRFQEWLRRRGWKVPEGADAFYDWTDPLRLLLHHPEVSGYQVAKRLEAAAVYPELADPLQVVCVVTAANREEDLDRLKVLLSYFVRHSAEQGKTEPAATVLAAQLAARWQAVYEESQLDAMELDQSWMHREREEVPWSEAGGRRSASMVVPYPPGIPLLLPGEVIRDCHLALLDIYHKLGAHVQGLLSGELSVLCE